VSFESFRDGMRRIGSGLAINLVVLRSVPSTNVLARRILAALPPEVAPPPRTCLVAWEQTAGRGRQGRRWASAAGAGLYCTLIEPLRGPEEVALLPLRVAVALCRAVIEAGVAGCRLKWPNDLLVGSRKIGGVLIEVVAGRRAGSAALIGLGVNLAGDPGRLARGATTLAREGAAGTTAADLLDRAMRELGPLLLERAPGGEVVAAYRELLRHRPGDEVTWRQGGETLSGRFAGVDDLGRLLLDTAGGRRSVSVGDIIEP
jgi:BirA family biotin operon repressor/biotin-[acetyl-CoA-carboxylase] ligase